MQAVKRENAASCFFLRCWKNVTSSRGAQHFCQTFILFFFPELWFYYLAPAFKLTQSQEQQLPLTHTHATALVHSLSHFCTFDTVGISQSTPFNTNQGFYWRRKEMGTRVYCTWVTAENLTQGGSCVKGSRTARGQQNSLAFKPW